MTCSSLLLDELLFNGVGDGKVDVQNLVDEHLDDLVFILLEILLDLCDFFCGLLFEGLLEFLILFLSYKSNTYSLLHLFEFCLLCVSVFINFLLGCFSGFLELSLPKDKK